MYLLSPQPVSFCLVKPTYLLAGRCVCVCVCVFMCVHVYVHIYAYIKVAQFQYITRNAQQS